MKVITSPSLGLFTSSFDARYLKLDGTNDPITGALLIQPLSNVVGALSVKNSSASAIFEVDTDGTVSEPYRFTGSINTYRGLTVTNTNNGNAASADFLLNVDNTTPTTNYFNLGLNGSACVTAPFATPNEAYIYNISNSLNIGALGATSKIKLYTNGGTTPTLRMTLDENGNVGIATTTPVARLHVNTGNDATKGLIVRNNSATQTANLQEWQTSAGNVNLYVDSAQRLRGTTGMYVKEAFYAILGQANADMSMVGLYDRNELTYAVERGSVTYNITGAGVAPTDGGNMFDGSGNFVTFTATDTTTTKIEITIDLLANQPNYSAAQWQPFVHYRLPNSTGFVGTWYKKITVEVSADAITWFKPGTGAWETTDATANQVVAGLWIGSLGNPVIVAWRYARFTLEDRQENAGYGSKASVWIAEIGLRHFAAPFTRMYLKSSGDNMYGDLVFIKNGTTSTTTKIFRDGSAIFNDLGDDVDFRIEGDTDANAFFVDGFTSNVGVGTNIPLAKLHVQGASGLDGATPVTLMIKSTNNGTWTDEAIATQILFDTADGSGTAGTRGAIKLYADDTTGNDNGLSFWTTSAGSAGLAEGMRIDHLGNIGISTLNPTNILSLGGNSARTFWMERHTTANTAGNTLTITAGGATSGATDKAGGNLILQGGLSTGNAESGVIIQGDAAGASGTLDGTQTTMIQVLGNKIGLFGVTPVVRPASANQATLTNSTGGTYDGTLVDVGATFNQANINNNFTDVFTLLTEIRTALVNLGAIKGSA